MVRSREGQLLAVVGEDLRVVCAARDGNVGHAVIEQVFGSQLGIRVNQHSIGGLVPMPFLPRSRKYTHSNNGIHPKVHPPERGCTWMHLDAGRRKA